MKLPRVLSSPLLWRFLVLLWFGVLFWLSSQTHLPSPASFEGVDMLEHAVFFSAGGMCFLLGLRQASFLVLAFAFLTLERGVDQQHHPGRGQGR